MMSSLTLYLHSQVNIVGMLVTLSANPETVDEVIRDLGKRHVTYGVASHHVPVMKQVPCSCFRFA